MKRINVVKTIVNMHSNTTFYDRVLLCALVLKAYGWVELGGGNRGCKTCVGIFRTLLNRSPLKSAFCG